MTTSEALQKLLTSYAGYYNIITENVTPPFAAEAAFHSHDEAYFLMKSAKLAEMDSHEYVFFATADKLDAEDVAALDETAWTEGLARTKPHSYHRSTDTILVLIADEITAEAKARIKKLRHYKSYRWTFQGWSQYRVIALELSTMRLTHNRLGQSLVKLYRNIFSIH